MENDPLSQKSSNELMDNQEPSEEINDIGLPKSSLQSFVKEFLAEKKIRGDKNIIPMLDKISRLFVYKVSSEGAEICTKCGKKTLNLEHIFEALRKLQLGNHIDKLVKDVKDIKNGDIDALENDQLEGEKIKENKNLKQLINKKKKRGGRKKKYFENEDERAEMKAMQEKMFEEARNDMNKQQESNMIEIGNANNEQNNEEEEDEEKNNNIELDEEKGKNAEDEDDKEKDKSKEKYSNLDKQLFINNGGEDDINFD